MALETFELDLVLLSKIFCGIHLKSSTRWSTKKKQSERKSVRTDYFHHGFKICHVCFSYLHGIGKSRLVALSKYYQVNGIVQRHHANSKKQPPKTLK